MYRLVLAICSWPCGDYGGKQEGQFLYTHEMLKAEGFQDRAIAFISVGFVEHFQVMGSLQVPSDTCKD